MGIICRESCQRDPSTGILPMGVGPQREFLFQLMTALF
jgi:hypothetical protein